MSNLFTGEDVMKQKKDMSLRMKNRDLQEQNSIYARKPFTHQMDR